MNLHLEKLREHAHTLALEHNPDGRRISAKALWARAEADIVQLRDFMKLLHSEKSFCDQPSEEWLLDHTEFLEAEIFGIAEEIGSLRAKPLPGLRNEPMLRISSICQAYLACTDGALDEESLKHYFNCYQEVAILTSAEAWFTPLFMKIELLRRLSRLIEPVRERRDICRLTGKVMSSIPHGAISPERLKQSLDETGVELPLSGALIAHLVRHLREYAEDTAHIGEWLICRLDSPPDNLDDLLSYEYRLQAQHQVAIGNTIGSLRQLGRWLWGDLFEQISVVERTLRDEEAGDYPRLDSGSRHALRVRVERLALRMKVPEQLVASQTIELANRRYRNDGQEKNGEAGGGALPPRESYAAYYLLEARGMEQLRQALKLCGKTGALPEAGLRLRATGLYFQLLACFTLVALIGFSVIVAYAAPSLSVPEWIIIALTLLVPASEWGVSAIHGLIERTTRPSIILRYDFSKGVPQEAATLVVIPVIWTRPEDASATADRLELHYLANRDPHIRFAILSDLHDAPSETTAGDDAVLARAIAEIDRLNDLYPGRKFHLFHRRRQWNPSEGAWIGWERKRGKLEEFARRLRGDRDTSFAAERGDSDALGDVRYIITLDADTRLPLESARRMIGAIHLPFNRPRLDETGSRVVEGYGVLQPRIGMSYESSQTTRLSSLYAGEAGLDPYAFAVSDPYQDALGQGIYTGKGIFSVEAFHRVLDRRIPDNQVLSHDLLEGGFLRAGFLSDIELIDDYPPTFLSHQKRLHRWTRGDWQLLPWLRKKAPNGTGELVPTGLSPITRWQIFDNLRRSLLQPSLLAVLLLAPSLLPGSTVGWIIVAALTLLLPVLRQLAAVRNIVSNPDSLPRSLAHAAVAFLTLPYQACMLLDAIGRALYRTYFSRKRLLEWTNQAEVERNRDGARAKPLYGLAGGWLLAIAAAALAFAGNTAMAQWTGWLCGLLWLLAPFAVRWLDREPRRRVFAFDEATRRTLRQLAQDIWRFYEDYVVREDNWLPPDNVQIEPEKGVAHRTSPTNIGMYATCVLAARDFGFIDTPGMIQRLERTIDTVERMEKWEGHLFNWYDTTTLEPLNPVYVSTVDSGNFVASLMAVKEGLIEWLQKDGDQPLPPAPSHRTHAVGSRFEVAFAEEIGTPAPEGTAVRGAALAARMEAIVRHTDFRPLHDDRTNLLSLGYHVRRHKRDEVLYDLLASEARQASFVAIALGQVSVAHWNALGRTFTRIDHQPVLLSWTGTMFEYLMPWLLMKTYRRTIWDSTYQAVVRRQIQYARSRNIPFGISESGYFTFDHQMNYQYRAFGVPELGFKRGLEQDLVQAPYATIMALPYAPEEGMQTLQTLERLGARGRYGFYEAVDFTPKRLPAGREHAVVRSFMAHHQGMSMITLSNLLLPRTMADRFHDNKEVQAAELLLQERVPRRSKQIRHSALYRSTGREEKALPANGAVRELASPHTPTPELCLLSNGRFSAIVTASGGGFSSWEGMSVSRWREEPVQDAWGSFLYIRDVASEQLWSPSFLPCRIEGDDYKIRFESHQATFGNQYDDVEATMEICVSPETDTEIRRIKLTNNGTSGKLLETTSFVELALSGPIADDAHPAFSKLFIRTEYDADSGCLVASRRKREAKERSLWAAHVMATDGGLPGQAEFETDRAAFIGRGHRLSSPGAGATPLKGKTGSVADPAFIMRRRIQLEPGEQAVLYIATSVAETREAAIEAAASLTNSQTVERAFRLARTKSQVELRSQRLDQADEMAFSRMAAQILYTPPLTAERSRHIADNRLGQPGLWPFGLSGDRPIIAVKVDSREQLSFIVKLLSGHEYLRRLGLRFDLIIINESDDGYRQQLQETLDRAVEHSAGRFGTEAAGIHVLPAGRLQPEQYTLLMAVSRIVLHAGAGGLSRQLKLLRGEPHAAQRLAPARPAGVPSFRSSGGRRNTAPSHDAGIGKEVLFYNGWGGFSPDGKQYRLLIEGNRHLPAPWINVLSNPEFGTIVSELGTGYTFWRNSRECKLTPWSNDPVLDPPGELGFLRDEHSGRYWPLAPAAGTNEQPYEVIHGMGSTTFLHERDNVRHRLDMFVPLDAPVKIMRLKLRNVGGERKSVSVTYYAEWVLGVKRPSNAPFIDSRWHPEAELLTAQNRYQDIFREATAFLGIYPQQKHRADGLSWTADQTEFIGRNGTVERPAALERTALSRRDGIMHASCGAVQRKLDLEGGEEVEVIILLGCASSREAAVALAGQFAQASRCDEAWSSVRSYWEETLGQIKVHTPSEDTNFLLNGWLLYQSLACRLWARTAFYQAGGAYGYRDQLQDVLSLLHARPELARKQILLHAAHQYEEGDVQHWWHVETDRGIRTLFSDDLLWLPYVASRYVEHTGDTSVLDETVPYIVSEPLREGEHERYEETVRSAQSGPVYEHCLRAIDKALSRIGEHGLPLIGVGDWNDGMNLVGAEGRGESVWLGWFLCEVLERFAAICEKRGDSDTAHRFKNRRAQFSEALHEHAWDGQWYRRAFTDAESWLGSVYNEECRIDAIAQSWSVISGAAPPERARQAMQSFDRELVDRELAVVRLLTPPFDQTEPSPGYIQGYPPGIRENGAQYTHGVIWSIIAWCKLGEGDKAFELFHMLNPINHTRTDHEVRTYTGEPYVMAADVYTASPHHGHSGWTWYTGASSWMYQSGIEWILGIRKRENRLYLNPRVPAEWPGFSVDYRYGGSVYSLDFRREADADRLSGGTGIALQAGADASIELIDDGKEHRVFIRL